MAPKSSNPLSKVVNTKSKAKQKPVPVKIVHDSPQVSEDMSWRARSDMEALQRAAEIRADKSRMRAAEAEAKRQIKNLSRVCK